MDSIWQKYKVEWLGLTQLCGGIPADPEIVKAWVDARKPRVRPPGGKSLDDIQVEVLESLARGEEFDQVECNILTFQRFDAICAVRAATIKAHLKDCARVMSGLWGRERGERAFSTRVVNDLYLDERIYWVPILRPEGEPIRKHDGERDKAVHPRPGISALKRFEYIAPWRLDFTLKVLAPKGSARLQESDLDVLMQYGGTHGYGAERGDGEGKYVATITRIEEGT